MSAEKKIIKNVQKQTQILYYFKIQYLQYYTFLAKNYRVHSCRQIHPVPENRIKLYLSPFADFWGHLKKIVQLSKTDLFFFRTQVRTHTRYDAFDVIELALIQIRTRKFLTKKFKNGLELRWPVPASCLSVP